MQQNRSKTLIIFNLIIALLFGFVGFINLGEESSLFISFACVAIGLSTALLLNGLFLNSEKWTVILKALNLVSFVVGVLIFGSAFYVGSQIVYEGREWGALVFASLLILPLTLFLFNFLYIRRRVA